MSLMLVQAKNASLPMLVRLFGSLTLERLEEDKYSSEIKQLEVKVCFNN